MKRRIVLRPGARRLIAFGAAVLCVGCVPGRLVVPPETGNRPHTFTARACKQSAPGTLHELELTLVTLTNDYRKKNAPSAPLVQCDEGLRQIARAHSAEMARANYFDHTDLSGGGPLDRVLNRFPGFVGRVAENLAYRNFRFPGTSGVAEDKIWSVLSMQTRAQFAEGIIDIWRRSPPHRENMERPLVTYVGIGVAQRGNKLYVTQLFAGPH